MIALFDEDGICFMVATHVEGLEAAYLAEVPDGTQPNDVWYDADLGEVQHSTLLTHAEAGIPATIPLHNAGSFPLPANTVADVDGVRHRGSLTLAADRAQLHFVDLKGARNAQLQVEVQDYAAARKSEYGTWEEQLELMAEQGFEAWRANIAAIKARHPKQGAGDGAATVSDVRAPERPVAGGPTVAGKG